MEILSRFDFLPINGSLKLEVTGGLSPYTFTIESGGGSIDSDNFLVSGFKPEAVMVKVVDANGSEALKEFGVYSYIQIVAKIIQEGMGLADGKVFLFNPESITPKTKDLFISVGVQSSKRIAGSRKELSVDGVFSSVQTSNYLESLSINIFSGNFEALERKNEVVDSLSNDYSQKIQEAYGFKIYRSPSSIINVSETEGPSIPYKFNFSFEMSYAVERIEPIDFYDFSSTKDKVIPNLASGEDHVIYFGLKPYDDSIITGPINKYSNNELDKPWIRY